MSITDKINPPFPLMKYFLWYAGLGGLCFYLILIGFFIHADRKALHEQYVENLVDKAKSLYLDIDRDFLRKHNIELQHIAKDQHLLSQLREEIDEIIHSDFSLAKIVLFDVEGVYLYDSSNPDNEGKPYLGYQEESFISALQGEFYSNFEEEDGHQYMEVYLPIIDEHNHQVVAVLEIYEDVSRFERRIMEALERALFIPTIIYLLFNLLLFWIILKADRIISNQTNQLMNIGQNLAKYVSPSAVQAILNAVKHDQELFRGERQQLIVFFSDVRGFTQYSETHSPEIVVTELNRLFEMQCQLIQQHGGIVDKFVGDEIMATFPVDKAQEALKVSISILETIKQDADAVFDIGISLHAGEAVVGSIGAQNRRDYTAIGDTINTGARLCSVAKAGEVIFSDTVASKLPYNLVEDLTSFPLEQLKGKQNTINVFKINSARKVRYFSSKTTSYLDF